MKAVLGPFLSSRVRGQTTNWHKHRISPALAPTSPSWVHTLPAKEQKLMHFKCVRSKAFHTHTHTQTGSEHTPTKHKRGGLNFGH